ncbi:MAG: SDR family oxidoreductase [Bacteroidota bacterium]|nr:SDR family oxidoreductase [Bacteroidota bacterium]
MGNSFLGKLAIVCGSTQGIGKACAIEFANAGANVVLIARNEDALKETLNSLNCSFPDQRHEYIVADFTQADILKLKINNFLEEVEAVHILVNNTGGPAAGPAFFANADEYTAAFNQHLICNQILVQEIVPYMKQAGFGRIINIISTSVKQPIPGLGVSNTIRAAVANWAKTLSVELAPFGITVNNVLPGYTSTKRIETLITSRANTLNKSIEEIRKEMENEIPMKRFGKPEEIAKAVAFLASDDASYINGVNLPVDGGKTSAN